MEMVYGGYSRSKRGQKPQDFHRIVDKSHREIQVEMLVGSKNALEDMEPGQRPCISELNRR
jgi:hypothetical protein